MREALAALRRRWWVALAMVVFAAFMIWIAAGAVRDGNDRRASRARIEANSAETARLTKVIEQQNALILSVTGPEAQARSAATLKRAIDDIRRSIDCAELSHEATYPACVEVVARLDAIRAGLDPFTPATAPTGAP